MARKRWVDAREAAMAAVVVVGLVVLIFFVAGAVVGAVSLIAVSFWNARRYGTGPGRRSGSARRWR